MTLEQKSCTIQMLLDLVEVSCKHERLTAARALLYIGQGWLSDFDSGYNFSNDLKRHICKYWYLQER
jgi:hypothetical protein